MTNDQLNREVLCGLNSSVAGWNPVAVACARVRLALLDQKTTVVAADGLQPVPPTALRTHEVHPEAVDVRLNLAEAVKGLVAADALEHAVGVRPAHYRLVTPATVATIKPPRNLRTQLHPAPCPRGLHG